tara:strand:+ start:171 stop:743 length:573 start_codon:yes stop_codon:yes gene_type:complete
MTLPTSGAISLENIQTEFGGSNPIGMNEYYRDGAYVPSSNTNVPTSGTISLEDFYGASAVITEGPQFNNPYGPAGAKYYLANVVATNDYGVVFLENEWGWWKGGETDEVALINTSDPFDAWFTNKDSGNPPLPGTFNFGKTGLSAGGWNYFCRNPPTSYPYYSDIEYEEFVQFDLFYSSIWRTTSPTNPF